MSSAKAPTRFTAGHLDVPDSWGMRSEMVWMEPKRQSLGVPLAGKANTTKPGANIMVSREPTTRSGAADELQHFMQDYVVGLQALTEVERGGLSFRDGTEGAYATIVFSPLPGFRIAQCHIFRIDRDIASHITISLDDHDRPRLEKELIPLALSFRE
jgi:hypothetical protein